MKTKITERRIWSMEDIRRVCINNELYTRGTNEEYGKMLERAESLEPFTENLYIIAKDIDAHSTDQTVSNIMCLLVSQAVRIVYEIEE